mmetsp:Transcript_59867/g.106452  ORF Transcript_59867/g.106452 Transcript_59867/m.106452 type:complete len:280 (-) Transcript_59867:63-902(-)
MTQLPLQIKRHGARGRLLVICVFTLCFPAWPGGSDIVFVGLSRLTSATVASPALPEELSDLPPDAKAWSEKHFVDEASKLAEKEVVFQPKELISKAKRFLALNNGFAGIVGDMMADEFEFAGPVVGPLNKQRYLESIAGFDFYQYFPDANFEMYDFRVDVFEPSRVWFTSRGTGTQTGTSEESPLFKVATGKSYVNPPQSCSISFNEKGLVTQYTIGYVMDRQVGNTGGLGGIYGILWAVGKPFPFPEANPRRPSLRSRIFNKLGEIMAAQKRKKADAA